MSSDPCTNNYQGPEPYSEPETRALADYLDRDTGRWAVYLSLHSQGQLVMAPWGYTYTPPEDFDDLVIIVGN